GAGGQRFPRVRVDGDRLVRVRPPAGELRLEHGRRGGAAGGDRGRRPLGRRQPAQPPARRVGPGKNPGRRDTENGANSCTLRAFLAMSRAELWRGGGGSPPSGARGGVGPQIPPTTWGCMTE